MNINPKKIIDQKIVKPIEQTKIQQVGIDLTVSKDVIIAHLGYESVEVNEEMNIPIDMFALVWSRSTFNRKGIIIRGTVLEPGYNGIPSFPVYNFSGRGICIPKNERICQIVFFHADAASSYDGQYQGEGIK